VFVLTKGEEGIKGSGRSIETYHMYENMTRVKECFAKFGGHKLAAGLTLAAAGGTDEETVAQFDRALNACCTLTEEDLIPRVHIDVPMPISYATMELAKDLEKMEPFGVGNAKPLFAEKNLRFLKGYKMGARKNCARFLVKTSDNAERELVYFGDLDRFAAFLDEKYGAGSGQRIYESFVDYSVSVTYQLGINSFRGTENLQMIMQNYD
jgi:single-stranded-DNA-specific exonuclease